MKRQQEKKRPEAPRSGKSTTPLQRDRQPPLNPRKLTAAEIIAVMVKEQAIAEKNYFVGLVRGEDLMVARFGGCGRTETLFIHSRGGYLCLEANGQRTTMDCAEGVHWFRTRLMRQNDSTFGEGLELFLAMIEGVLAMKVTARQKANQKAGGKAKEQANPESGSPAPRRATKGKAGHDRR